jgi:predicted Zn finger-like uncharacterized protein
MPIDTQCPRCDTAYTLPDTQAGKRVRCRQCSDSFTVPGGAAEEPPVLEDAGPDERLAREPVSRKSPAKVVPVRRPSIRRDRDDEEAPARRKGSRKAEDEEPSNMVPHLIIGGGVLLLLLLAGGVGLWLWSVSQRPAATVVINGPDVFAPDGVNPPAGFNDPKWFGDPKGPPGKQPWEKEPAGKDRPPAGNPFPPLQPAPDPFAQPKDLNDALAMLKDSQVFRRKNAAEWLGRAPLDEARRAEVAQALAGQLNDALVGVPAATALGVWGTKDSVPALLKVVENENNPAWTQAMDVLAKLKDERAAEPAARYLPNFFKRGSAVKVLREIGPPAEKEVLKYLHNKDAGVRTEATNLLKGYGTKDAVLFDQAVADLKAADGETRQVAAETLGRTKLDAMHQAEVAKGLDPLLTDTYGPVRDAALQALTVWATTDNVPSLLKLLDDNNRPLRWKAMDLLPRFQEDRVALALAAKLNTPDRNRAVNALKTMGAVAEKAAVQCLASTDPTVRREACTILGAVGTKASIPFLKQAVAVDKGLSAAAQGAIKAIEARP